DHAEAGAEAGQDPEGGPLHLRPQRQGLDPQLRASRAGPEQGADHGRLHRREDGDADAQARHVHVLLPAARELDARHLPGQLGVLERERLDRSLSNPPGRELPGRARENQVRAVLPEADVGEVGLRRSGRVGRVGVEDGELVAVVLEVEDEARVRCAQLEPERARGGVDAGQVALRDPAPEGEEPARLVRRFVLGVPFQLAANRRGHYHQWPCSIACSASGASQKSAERYFQPPSARMQTTTPSSSSAASRAATCTTAPEERPAKIPSRSTSARTPASDSAFETSSFRSSFATSRIGGTYPSSSERSPITGSPGSGSAAATSTSGKLSRSRSPAPISVPPVPSPATTRSTRSSASAISAPVPS